MNSANRNSTNPTSSTCYATLLRTAHLSFLPPLDRSGRILRGRDEALRAASAGLSGSTLAFFRAKSCSGNSQLNESSGC